MFDLLDLQTTCSHQTGDILDLPRLEAAIQAARPDVLLHMAAQPLVRASYSDPILTYATNVMGTVHVLDACRRSPGLRAVVVVTTDKCYENNGWIWGYRENDRLGGADPYSNSKAACELVVGAYRESFFSQAPSGQRVHLASARAGNVIGGGDFAQDRLIPDAIRAFSAGETLKIRNPLSIRPWQHVLEPLNGYLLLAERLHDDPSLTTGWNFGPPQEDSASVRHVADIVADLWSDGAAWSQDPAEHPHEAATLKLDSTKARIELGWSPALSLREALGLTTKWYKEYDLGGDMAELTRTQVRDYLDRSAGGRNR
jgi:CDP-glucose 4,6-dehydratase